MNKFIKKIFACVLFCMAIIPLRAQVVVTVLTNDGTEQKISVSDNGEMQISTESLTIAANENDTFCFLLDEVSKVLFSSTVSIRNVESGPKISLIPNPTSDCFMVNGITEGRHEMSVYAANGAEVIRRLYSAGEYVDISALPQGLYLVRINNSVGKLIKK